MTQTAPAATGGTVKTYIEKVTPKEPRTIIFDATDETVAVGADGTTVFGVYDAHKNLVTADFSTDILATMVPNVNNTVRRAFSSDPDVGASFGPPRRARRCREIRVGVQRARRGHVHGRERLDRRHNDDADETLTLVAATARPPLPPPRVRRARARRRRGDDVPVIVADRYGNGSRTKSRV